MDFLFMKNIQQLKEKVKDRISEYLEFDVNEIFNVADYITIYGGAVRDSIAGMEINDVDILCMPDSAKKLKDYILKYNYTPIELYDEDAINMYRGISVISEPWTFINYNKKIIQIIRPRFYINKMSNYSKEYIESYTNLIKNVDFSCCGVFLEKCNDELELKESCKNGIIHCLSKSYEINHWATLYNSNRAAFREHKLSSRGWFNIDENHYPWNQKEIKNKERSLKIINLEFNLDQKYKIWTEEEYKNRKKPENDLPF